MASEPRFFMLEEASGSMHDTEFSTVAPVHRGEPPRCPRCTEGVGMLTWLPPCRGTLVLHGQEFGDFLRGPGDGLLLSERFAEAFRQEGLTGLSGFHPVEVVRVRRRGKGPKPPPVPRYLYVTDSLGSAAIDEARSRIRRSEPITCDYCRCTGVDANGGFSLEAGSWAGEDIFRPRGLTGRHVVSERFAHLVARHGFTHLQLIPIEEVRYDYAAPSPPDPPVAKS